MISRSNTIQEILNHNPLLELVLERYGWERTCGQKRIESEFGDNCPNIDFLVDVLKIFDQPEFFSARKFRSYPIPVILDYLYRTHRYYVEKRLLEIEQSAELLARYHAEDYSMLLFLRNFFVGYRVQLCEHIELEEYTLFPYIKHLMQKRFGRRYFFETDYSELSHYSLDEFVISHTEDDLDQQLLEVRQLVEKKHPEIKKLLPFKILASQLDAFSKDLYIHELIEEEVLIPLARDLESKK